MKILIVEDSKSERDLLKYLLESRFQQEAKFREASNLETATSYLLRGDVDCVLLDLQLPDSAGRETFLKLATRFPQVPVIVMTNNKDRALALDLIQLGAADFVSKKFTDEEELFRRVLFAIEKHQRSVRMAPEDVSTVRRLDVAQANLLSAHQSGEHIVLQGNVVEVTSSIADISRSTFTKLQEINQTVSQQAASHTQVSKAVENLHTELLKGYDNRPSLKSQVEVLNDRVVSLEEHFNLERNTKFELTQKSEKRPLATNAKIVVTAVIGICVGLLVALLL